MVVQKVARKNTSNHLGLRAFGFRAFRVLGFAETCEHLLWRGGQYVGDMLSRCLG